MASAWRNVLISLAVLASAAACEPAEVGVYPDADEVVYAKHASPEALLRVPGSGAGGIDVRVSSSGARRAKERQGHGCVVVRATVVLENRGEKTASFYEASSLLLDADRRPFAPDWPAGIAAASSTTPAVSGDSTARRLGPVDLAPGERRAFELAFRTDRTRDPLDALPCSLVLELSYAGHDHQVEVRLTSGYPYGGYRYYYGGGWGNDPYWGYPYGGWYGPNYGWGPGWYGGYGYGWGPYW